MTKPEDYKMIAAWGRYMQSFTYYVKKEQQYAARDDAPLNVVYLGNDGTWVTTDDLSERTQELLKRLI